MRIRNEQVAPDAKWKRFLSRHDFLYRVYFKLNLIVTARPFFLNLFGLTLSVIDKFGTPGDTLLTGIVCRHIKMLFPRVRINCITHNPQLLKLDPHIDVLNAEETFFSLPVWYFPARGSHENLLKPVFDALGVKDYQYKANVYLSTEEVNAAKASLAEVKRPIICFNATSREKVKTWPVENWRKLVGLLKQKYTLAQLGDEIEPAFKDVITFAGKLSMRESMAILSQADGFIGPVSFLMHAANGLNVPAVIIYGGRETPLNSGYKGNINIYTKLDCSPCFIHNTGGEECPIDIVCMKMILPEIVYEKVEEMMALGSVSL